MPEPIPELQPARILSVAEDELSRIVLDIHDGPVQYLFTALSLLTSLQNELGDAPAGHAGSARSQIPPCTGIRTSPDGSPSSSP